jgi:hypothetical protein
MEEIPKLDELPHFLWEIIFSYSRYKDIMKLSVCCRKLQTLFVEEGKNFISHIIHHYCGSERKLYYFNIETNSLQSFDVHYPSGLINEEDIPKSHVASIRCAGRIFIIGGRNSEGKSIDSVYELQDDTFKMKPLSKLSENKDIISVAEIRYSHNDQIFIFAAGGIFFNRIRCKSTVEKYNIRNNEWIQAPRMNEEKFGLGLIFMFKFQALYSFGGFKFGEKTNAVEMLDLLKEKEWQIITISETGFKPAYGILGAPISVDSLILFDAKTCDTYEYNARNEVMKLVQSQKPTERIIENFQSYHPAYRYEDHIFAISDLNRIFKYSIHQQMWTIFTHGN